MSSIENEEAQGVCQAEGYSHWFISEVPAQIAPVLSITELRPEKSSHPHFITLWEVGSIGRLALVEVMSTCPASRAILFLLQVKEQGLFRQMYPSQLKQTISQRSLVAGPFYTSS